ncbi:MAG TPA: hypothetical protein ENN73_05540 [Firmicutes bacterium]|nr:hypothetical protein [Bacillota bacterium]
MKPTPISGLILLLIQLIFISISDIPVFPFFIFIIIFFLIILQNRISNLKRLLISEFRILPLILFIMLSYTYFNNLPRIEFSYDGFLISVKQGLRLLIIVSFISLYFFIFTEADLITELTFHLGRQRHPFVQELLMTLILTLYLFKPALDNERRSQPVKDDIRFSFRRTGDYLFLKFIHLLNFCREKSRDLEHLLLSPPAQVSRSLEHSVIWVIAVIVLNILFVLGSEHFHNLKGIF